MLPNFSSTSLRALIFMKGHSVRVPGKNMRTMRGKPLFHWIMKTLEGSQYIKEIIINTDSEEIAKSALDNFKVTIHMRPNYLLKIENNEANQIIEYDLSITEGEYFLQTHSTNPLLTKDTIDLAIEYFFVNQSKHDSLLSVTKHYKRFYTENGKPINHDPFCLVKTQDMHPLYEENSAIYLFSRNCFLKNKNRIGNSPFFMPIRPQEALDIDEPRDFEIAETFMKSQGM